MPTTKTTKVTPKKVATKTAAKKTAAVKKAVTKTVAKKSTKATAAAKKPLIYAVDQQAFWVKNGQILNSLLALRDALDEMEKEVYTYHAGATHNDFAQWVSLVLADHACAAELGKAKTPQTAKTVVVRHLKSYTI